jgi:DNA-binding PadR family transcriptional regulator
MVMKFSHPSLVLSALEQARREPMEGEISPSLMSTMRELEQADLVEWILQRRGRVSRIRVRLTETGLARLRRAHKMAKEIASEDV